LEVDSDGDVPENVCKVVVEVPGVPNLTMHILGHNTCTKTAKTKKPD